MTYSDPREFAQAAGETVTITLQDGRTFRAYVDHVRSAAGYATPREVTADIMILPTGKTR